MKAGGKYSRARGQGELGMALDALAEEHGTLTALARELGCGIESLSRWVRGEAKPAPKYAERLCELQPGLRALLEREGCFTAPNRRPRSPSSRGPGKSMRTQQRIAAATKAAKRRAAAPDLPWPSKATKRARKSLLKLLLAARKAKAAEPEAARKRGARRIARKSMPSYPSRVSHTGDFIERLDELTAADARFVPSYEREDFR